MNLKYTIWLNPARRTVTWYNSCLNPAEVRHFDTEELARAYAVKKFKTKKYATKGVLLTESTPLKKGMYRWHEPE